MSDRSLSEIVEAKLRHIAAHRERYLEAWFAETGLLPSQAELVEIHGPDEVCVRVQARPSAKPLANARQLVVIESPLKGEVAHNVLYADCCQFDALVVRHEAPCMGHLQYTRVLDDSHAEARDAGIAAHVAWIAACDVVAVYTDLGITGGMSEALRVAVSLRKSIDYRSLGAAWEQTYVPRLRATPGFFDCRR